MAEFTRLGDRYDVGSVIGRGGMAEVYEATDTRLNRRVAIKVLRGDLARDPLFIERFRREAQSAAGLNHPNIVSVYDSGEDLIGDVHIPYIVMELVDGVTLRHMLHNGPRILPERGLELIAGVLAALDYAHRHGIIHRDIKPANVMINAHGDTKVMDFGIARAVSDAATTVTATSAVMGTAQYLSPEQARGEVVDARSDIYSAGCVLYELLTGVPPFTGETPVSIAYQHVNESPKAPSLLDSSIPSAIDAIVLHSLSKHPSQRYQTAADMRADVERFMAGMPISAPVPVSIGVSDTNAPTAAMRPIPAAPTASFPAITSNSGFVQERERNRLKGRWIAGALAVAGAAALLFILGNNLFGGKPTTVTVPNLSGMTIQEATTALKNSQLVLGTPTPQADDNVPKGQIIGQDPAPGELIEAGQAINVTVSNGKEQTLVPDLVNLATQADADLALKNSRLVLGKVTPLDSSQPAGTVLSQSIPANSSIDVGTPIDIVVSSGKIAVPDVMGKTKTQARNDLINAGFLVELLTEVSDTDTPGTVIAQTPIGKQLAVKGTTVTITIAVAPTPTPSSSA